MGIAMIHSGDIFILFFIAFTFLFCFDANSKISASIILLCFCEI